MNREHELELRLAESRHTETELRRVIGILLHEGDAVFRSRSWRWGRRLSAVAARVLQCFGGNMMPAQDAQHWHAIVAAHDDNLLRRRLLLEQLCQDAAVPQDLDDVLHQLWRQVGAEQAVAASRDRA